MGHTVFQNHNSLEPSSSTPEGGEIDICVHWLFCKKFNARQLFIWRIFWYNRYFRRRWALKWIYIPVSVQYTCNIETYQSLEPIRSNKGGEIGMCAHWLSCTKFNAQELLFEMFFNIIGNFGSIESCVWITMHESDIHCTQLFVYLRRTTVSYGVKSYYALNFHSTIRLNHMLHVCILVSHNILYHSIWNFYSVSSNAKLSSLVNLVSFHSIVAAYEFRETYFWDDCRACEPLYEVVLNSYLS